MKSRFIGLPVALGLAVLLLVSCSGSDRSAGNDAPAAISPNPPAAPAESPVVQAPAPAPAPKPAARPAPARAPQVAKTAPQPAPAPVTPPGAFKSTQPARGDRSTRPGSDLRARAASGSNHKAGNDPIGHHHPDCHD